MLGWLFQRRREPALPFVSGEAAFEYACVFLTKPLDFKSRCLALVGDLRDLGSSETAVASLPSGEQLCLVKALGPDGPYSAFGKAKTLRGPRLSTGDLVCFEPLLDAHTPPTRGMIVGTLQTKLTPSGFPGDQRFK